MIETLALGYCLHGETSKSVLSVEKQRVLVQSNALPPNWSRTELDAMVHVDRVGARMTWNRNVCHSRDCGFGVGDRAFSQHSVGQTQSMAWLGQCRLIDASSAHCTHFVEDFGFAEGLHFWHTWKINEHANKLVIFRRFCYNHVQTYCVLHCFVISTDGEHHQKGYERICSVV